MKQSTLSVTLPLDLVLTLLLIAFSFSGCLRAGKTGTAEDIDQYMASLATNAVERARSGYGITLDYSSNSVQEVEKLLAMKYDMQKTRPMSERDVEDAAHLWGAYIGEVMKLKRPAHWARDSAAAGADALPIVFNDTREESYPCAWVYHRLKNGEGDNVWVKFTLISQPGGLKQYFPPKKKAEQIKSSNTGP
jgi:hypothetical protein